jgi:hypothetical protein
VDLKVAVSLKGAIWEGKAPELVQAGITSAMWEATSFLEREVKKRTPKGVGGAQGGLISTVHGEVIEKGIPVVKGIIAHGSAYGDVVDKGRTPGKKWPPEGVLLKWIELKLGVDEVQAKRLEFVIRRKIGKKGFPGAIMFEKTMDETWPRLKDIFDRGGFEITRQLSQ